MGPASARYAGCSAVVMNRRLYVGRLFAVEVWIDWSWIVTFVLAACTLLSVDRRLLPEAPTTTLVGMALATALGLLVALAAHELVRVHAVRVWGVPVRRTVLFVLGGVTNTERSPASLTGEIVGAVAAPLASLVGASVIGLSVAITSGPLPRGLDDLQRLGPPGIVLLQVAAASFLVATVNLLPAYPLDGGRILRAILWKATRDVDRATRLAAFAGRITGWVLVFAGILVALGTQGPVVGAGMWLAFVGWFVASAAAQGHASVIAQRRHC